MPGRTESTIRSSPVNLSAQPGTSGRGPTKLMLPVSTSQSCTSSSIFVFLSTDPSRVIRGSWLVVTVVVCTMDERIDRILCTLQVLPRRPTRSWVKIPHSLVSTVAANTARMIMGDTHKSPGRAIKTSNSRLTSLCLYVRPRGTALDIPSGIAELLQRRTCDIVQPSGRLGAEFASSLSNASHGNARHRCLAHSFWVSQEVQNPH